MTSAKVGSQSSGDVRVMSALPSMRPHNRYRVRVSWAQYADALTATSALSGSRSRCLLALDCYSALRYQVF